LFFTKSLHGITRIFQFLVVYLGLIGPLDSVKHIDDPWNRPVAQIALEGMVGR
jgi:hypothetical protein